MKNNKIIFVSLILWPYIYLFPHTFGFLEMGNDFELLYFSYKKYIFEFLKIGHFPKWLPTDSSGYSLIFNPFAQYFYPPSWLLYLIAFINGDLTKNLFWIYTVFALSIYNIGQYLWLREIKIEKKYALIATIITCCGLKLTEVLRFPNAVHAIAWFPWVLLGITQSIYKINKVKSSSIIFLSTLMIFTAGYPYYILYGLILFSSYFFFLFPNRIKYDLFNVNYEMLQSKKSYFFNCLIPASTSFLIASPWLIKIKEIMSYTSNRNIEDIKFSFTSSSSFLDQVASWVHPPFAITEGWYYFGAINSILILFFFISIFIFKEFEKREKYFILFFVSILIVNYQFAAAENSYIFRFLWDKIDLIKNFRIFSRMNIILIPIFSIIIALSIKKFVFMKDYKKRNISLLISIFIIITIQIYLINFYNFENSFWNTWQLKRLISIADTFDSFSKIIMLHDNYWYLIFAISTLSLLIINTKKVYLFIVLLTISELFFIANVQWALPVNYYGQNEYNKLSKTPMTDLQNSFKKKNIVTEIKGNSYFRNNRSFNINYFDDFGMAAHSKIIDQYFQRNGKFKKDLTDFEIYNLELFYALNNNTKKFFFTKNLFHNNINEFLNDSTVNEKKYNILININYKLYTGDEVYFTINSDTEGFITFVDNWAPGWRATNNNKPSKIYKMFNAYKSVKVYKGENKIRMKYTFF